MQFLICLAVVAKIAQSAPVDGNRLDDYDYGVSSPATDYGVDRQEQGGDIDWGTLLSNMMRQTLAPATGSNTASPNLGYSQASAPQRQGQQQRAPVVSQAQRPPVPNQTQQSQGTTTTRYQGKQRNANADVDTAASGDDEDDNEAIISNSYSTRPYHGIAQQSPPQEQTESHYTSPPYSSASGSGRVPNLSSGNSHQNNRISGPSTGSMSSAPLAADPINAWRNGNDDDDGPTKPVFYDHRPVPSYLPDSQPPPQSSQSPYRKAMAMSSSAVRPTLTAHRGSTSTARPASSTTSSSATASPTATAEDEEEKKPASNYEQGWDSLDGWNSSEDDKEAISSSTPTSMSAMHVPTDDFSTSLD